METPINLDDLPPDALAEQWLALKDSQDPGAQLLAAYAAHRKMAIQCRESGNSCSAGLYETLCEKTYEALPEDLRWEAELA